MRYLKRTIFSRSPRTAAAAVVIAAMGIGISGAALNVLFSSVVSPLLQSASDRVFYLYEFDERDSAQRSLISYPAIQQWKARSGCFEKFAVEKIGFSNLRVAEKRRSAMIGMVSPGYMAVRGAVPQLGRDLLGSDSGPPQPEILISHRLWASLPVSTELAGSVLIGHQRFEVIGVMPEGLDATGLDAWIDIRHLPSVFPEAGPELSSWQVRGMRGLVRLKQHCSRGLLEQDLARVSREISVVSPASHEGVYGRLEGVYHKTLRRIRAPILSFGAAALLGLLLVTFNVVVLVFHDTVKCARDRETRIALGASRARIVVPGLLDVFFIVLLGYLAALPICFVLQPALDSLTPSSLTWYRGASGPALVYASTGVSAVLLIAVVGFLQYINLNREAIRLLEQSRSLVSPRRSRWVGPVVIFAQIALTSGSVLLASNLLVSYRFLAKVELGYNSNNVIAVGVLLPANQYVSRQSRFDYFENARSQLASLPGVSDVAAGLDLPLQGFSCWEKVGFLGLDSALPGAEVACQLVGPGYFKTLEVPIFQGETWKLPSYREEVVRQVLVNKTFVRTFLPLLHPIGTSLELQDGSLVEIIGVVGDIHHGIVEEEVQPVIYLPGYGTFMHVLVRSRSEPLKLLEKAELVLGATETDAALFSSRLVETVVLDETEHMRTLAMTVVVGAGLSLLIGLIGVYVVVAQTVGMRRREFLLRMALGATPRRLARGILVPVLAATVAGFGAGVISYLGLMPLFQQLLFGFSLERPEVVIAGVAFLIVCSAVAAAGMATLGFRRASLQEVARARGTN